MKFFSLLALISVVVAADGDSTSGSSSTPSAGDSGTGSSDEPVVPAIGRDRIVGETCVKDEDRCTANEEEK